MIYNIEKIMSNEHRRMQALLKLYLADFKGVAQSDIDNMDLNDLMEEYIYSQDLGDTSYKVKEVFKKLQHIVIDKTVRVAELNGLDIKVKGSDFIIKLSDSVEIIGNDFITYIKTGDYVVLYTGIVECRDSTIKNITDTIYTSYERSALEYLHKLNILEIYYNGKFLDDTEYRDLFDTSIETLSPMVAMNIFGEL